MKYKTHTEAWEDFKATVLVPHELNESTMLLMETVFFSGGKAMFGLLMTAADQENEDKAADEMDAIGEELDKFYAEMQERSQEWILRQVQEAANGN